MTELPVNVRASVATSLLRPDLICHAHGDVE